MNTTLTEHETVPSDIATHASVDHDSTESDFQVATIWRTLGKRKWLIAGLAIVGAIIGFVLGSLATRMYTATATIEVNKLTESPLGVSNLNGLPEPYGSGEEMTAALLTDQAELQSATVAMAVIDKTGLLSAPPYSTLLAQGGRSMASLPRKQREQVLQMFSSHLKVALEKDTKLIDVSFSDPDPERAALVANEVIESFTHFYAETRNTASEASAKLLTAQLADLRAQVLESEQRVSDYEQQTGIIGSPEGANSASGPAAVSVVTDRLVDLNHSLTVAEIALNQKAAILRVIESQNPEAVMNVSANMAGANAEGTSLTAAYSADIGLLGALRQQRSTISLQIATLSNTYGSKSPSMVDLHAQLDEVNQQIAAVLARIRRTAQSEYDVASANEQGLLQMIAKQEQQVTKMTVSSNQLMVLQQEATSRRKLYQDLYAKLQESSVAANMNASNITVVDPARPPVSSTPKTRNAVGEGLLIGALAGIFSAFLLDAADTRLSAPETL